MKTNQPQILVVKLDKLGFNVTEKKNQHNEN